MLILLPSQGRRICNINGERNVKAIRYWVTPLLWLLAGASGVSAQTSLESKVQRLEESVLRLENRLAELEAQQRGRTVVAPPADKLGWRQLKQGMSEGEVEKLLGSPTNVSATSRSKTWRYLDRGFGEVDFLDGVLRGWREP
jgi:hypothetical protein